jgi:hypothetical protein
MNARLDLIVTPGRSVEQQPSAARDRSESRTAEGYSNDALICLP